HLSGMALNGELKALGARLVETAVTAPDYKLYALPGAPARPGMLRVEAGQGSPIELEVWTLSAASFGQFVAAVPAPLTIGTIRLAHGGSVKGFLVEAAGIEDARDISAFGGWRAYVARAAAE
ncbi:allophanate hydrolase-related protein, partial [Bradyrhizobium sp.]|uniref:allophanate hydrolase-related protein n=1 Tax=Bradyrhizobium sp. TaxID=376 RepID=UPI003C4BB856